MHVKTKKHHKTFIDTLIKQMLEYDLDTPSPEVVHRL